MSWLGLTLATELLTDVDSPLYQGSGDLHGATRRALAALESDGDLATQDDRALDGQVEAFDEVGAVAGHPEEQGFRQRAIDPLTHVGGRCG